MSLRSSWRKIIGPAILATIILALITGLAYPLLVTGVAQLAFPYEANGSMISVNNTTVGSELIGQQFTMDKYFHGRPSAAGNGYDGMSSGGSNLGPSSDVLYDRVNDTVNASQASGDVGSDGKVAADAATASGSGLDPHITVANALDQVPRVAKARGLDEGTMRGLVAKYTLGRDAGFMGEPRVNVLDLNIALDRGETAPATPADQLSSGDPQFFGYVQIVVVLGLVIALAYLMGNYLFMVITGRPTRLKPFLDRFERRIYRLLGVDAAEEMNWKSYTLALLAFSFVSFLFTYLVLRLQGGLPLNPLNLPGVRPEIAMNTAVSFGTNTNWQTYAGEQTMSYLSQMLALTFQNFVSAAVGIAVVLALIRAIAKKKPGKGLGNFWVDITRVILYVLIPISIVVALVLVSQGVPQTLNGPAQVTTLEGDLQTIALGPVASQEAIKELGTNGGGFFNANSAHPYENPTPITNVIEIVLTLVIPLALIFLFGLMALSRRHGAVLLAVVLILFIVGLAITTVYEQRGNPALNSLGVDQAPSGFQAGGNMEGKEVRFGIYGSTLFDVTTTAVSCGAVNSMLDSYTPLGGAVPLFLILLGEVVPGGVGAGFYTLFIYILLTIFMAGLMIGRIPVYMGKKVNSFDMKMAMLAIISLETTILVLSALAFTTGEGANAMLNRGPHGLTEVIYAYGSGVGNNGSAFGGLNAATLWFSLTLILATFLGRFMVIISVMAIAGSFALKDVHPTTAGTLPTDNGTFGVFLAGVILIVAGLSFLPIFVLGPILEHLLLSLGGIPI